MRRHHAAGTKASFREGRPLKTVLRVRNGIISNTFYAYDDIDSGRKPLISWQTCFWRNFEYSCKKPGWDLRNSYDNWSYFMIVIIVVDLGHQPVELFVHYDSKDPKHFQSGQTTRNTSWKSCSLIQLYRFIYVLWADNLLSGSSATNLNMIFNWCEMHIRENEVFFLH